MLRWLSKITTGIALGAFGLLMLFLLAITVGCVVVFFWWLESN